MTNPTIEGIVENGQIRLLENVRLPENTRVFVVIAENNPSRPPRIYSPRLAHPEQAADFVKRVSEVSTDAPV
jgi:hypothetical protein